MEYKRQKSFEGYAYTGSLRKGFVAQQLKMDPSIPVPDHAHGGTPTMEVEEAHDRTIHIYSPEEIVKVRKVCQIAREVLDLCGKFLKAGVTGDQIDRLCYTACQDRGVYPSPLNYYEFPKTLCVSPNEVICHGIPDDRVIENGDIVNLDVSIYHDGYHADLNETFFIGEVDEDSQKLVRTAFDCLSLACDMIKPGTFYRDLGKVITKRANAAKCSVVKRYCGHGVGRLFHTTPQIPHYAKNKAIGIMKPGHIFTIEPMINLGPRGDDDTWPDNWTAVRLVVLDVEVSILPMHPDFFVPNHSSLRLLQMEEEVASLNTLS